VAARLRRVARLRDPRDFQRVNRTGVRRASEHFVTVVAASGPAPVAGPRLGLAVSRRVGNAVARNRVKRRVREWFRKARPALPPESDWVVIARAGAAQLDTRAVADELSGLAGR
jgi:ribonuclease P protein component